MIELKEVIDFINNNKEIFEIFEKELKEIGSINNNIKKSTGNRIFLKEYSWIEESKAQSYQIDYKGVTHKRTSREMFLETLTSCLPAILKKEEFNFTSNDVEKEFDSINLATKEEKIIFLSSLYTMLFSVEFLEKYDNSSLEDFLREKKLLIFIFEKNSIETILQSNVNIKENANTIANEKERRTFRYLRSMKMMHANQLLTDVRSIRNKIDKNNATIYDKRYYEDLKDFLTKNQILPQNTYKKIKKVFEKPQVKEMVANISNDFAIKTALKSMPDRFTEAVYLNFIKGVQDTKENEKYNRTELEFIAAKFLVEKYTYQKISSLGYIGWAGVSALTNINFETNKYYKKIYEMQADMIAAYIKKNTRDTNIGSANKVAGYLFSMSMLYNQPEEKMKAIIESTKINITAMLNAVAPNKVQELEKLYNYKDIKNKKFFKMLKPELNKYYFYINSKNFLSLTKEQRDMICNDYLNAVVLENTIYNRANKIEINEEPQENESMERIFEEIAELFDLKRH